MDSTEARDRLEQERMRLTTVREGVSEGGISDELADDPSELSNYDQHAADAGTETSGKTQDLMMLNQIEAELADVERALVRIDDGTYGTCEACGKPIGDARLEALPATRFCVEDQATAETEPSFGELTEDS